ncbi:MAG TPA: prephenate dehydrogenase/arogenate dehydrogenase family protein [Candidatus Limnocylindria bacterium]|nr:prephenate dehydrogenase/arogenate dehydrogenase family protein [Candidatus Limnocylindria bacterium]
MNVSIAGLGLIGGSLALALRSRHRVTGFDSDAAARAAAGSAGVTIVDSLDGLLPADAVLIATPMSAVVPTLAALCPRADSALLMDVASLKRPVAAFAESARATARIVGGHPMAGATASGFDAASGDLFRGRPFLLVPTARSDGDAMALAGTLARDTGAVVSVCSAEVHDRAMAFLLAAPLAAASAVALAGAEAYPLLALAGPGFRDTTRLADTPLDLATELLTSGTDVHRAIDAVIENLGALRASIDGGRHEQVRDTLRAGKRVRDGLR